MDRIDPFHFSPKSGGAVATVVVAVVVGGGCGGVEVRKIGRIRAHNLRSRRSNAGEAGSIRLGRLDNGVAIVPILGRDIHTQNCRNYSHTSGYSSKARPGQIGV